VVHYLAATSHATRRNVPRPLPSAGEAASPVGGTRTCVTGQLLTVPDGVFDELVEEVRR
jgi:hypothetical protein